MEYGKAWQKRNNLLRRSFDPVHVEKYYDTNVLWSNRLLRKLLENPKNFYQDTIEYANSHCSCVCALWQDWGQLCVVDHRINHVWTRGWGYVGIFIDPTLTELCEVSSRSDPYLVLIEAGLVAAIDAATPGKYLVDSLPWRTSITLQK